MPLAQGTRLRLWYSWQRVHHESPFPEKQVSGPSPMLPATCFTTAKVREVGKPRGPSLRQTERLTTRSRPWLGFSLAGKVAIATTGKLQMTSVAHINVNWFVLIALLRLGRECLRILETHAETFPSTEGSATCFHKIKKNKYTEKITLCAFVWHIRESARDKAQHRCRC